MPSRPSSRARPRVNPIPAAFEVFPWAELKPEERAELGIGDGLVRFSAGLEAEADLLSDIERALTHV